MKIVVVTGAAGSIGREVCARLLSDYPDVMVIGIDIAETPLFWMGLDFGGGNFITRLGDVTDEGMWQSLKQAGIHPDVIIHAAACKHVGLAEANPRHAAMTNIVGTAMAMDAARRFDARFVLVSTDKAVEPTTFMGKTKRVAELMASGNPKARIVRLVNVYPSQGNVLEVWERQKARGEPMIVTDPDMQRYYMPVDKAAWMIAMTAMVDIEHGGGAQLIVPAEAEVCTIGTMAKERANGHPIRIVGKLATEKMIELPMTAAEQAAAYRSNDVWIIPVLDNRVQGFLDFATDADARRTVDRVLEEANGQRAPEPANDTGVETRPDGATLQ